MSDDQLVPYVPVELCTCCPTHAERQRRMEERVRDMAVQIDQFMTTVGPAMAMIGQPGGIASLLFSRKGKG